MFRSHSSTCVLYTSFMNRSIRITSDANIDKFDSDQSVLLLVHKCFAYVQTDRGTDIKLRCNYYYVERKTEKKNDSVHIVNTNCFN